MPNNVGVSLSETAKLKMSPSKQKSRSNFICTEKPGFCYKILRRSACTSCKSSVNVCRSMFASFASLLRKRENNTHVILMFLLITVLYNQVVKSGEADVILLYTSGRPLFWSTSMYGAYLSVYYACMSITLLIIQPVVERWVRPRDSTLIILGYAMKSLRLLVTGLTYNTTIIFVMAIAGSVAGFVVSAVKSIISKLVSESEVCTVFAVVASLETLANLIGGSLFTVVYALTVSTFPGAIFIADAIFHFLFVIAFILLRSRLSDIEQNANLQNTDEIDKAENSGSCQSMTSEKVSGSFGTIFDYKAPEISSADPKCNNGIELNCHQIASNCPINEDVQCAIDLNESETCAQTYDSFMRSTGKFP